MNELLKSKLMNLSCFDENKKLEYVEFKSPSDLIGFGFSDSLEITGAYAILSSGFEKLLEDISTEKSVIGLLIDKQAEKKCCVHAFGLSDFKYKDHLYVEDGGIFEFAFIKWLGLNSYLDEDCIIMETEFSPKKYCDNKRRKIKVENKLFEWIVEDKYVNIYFKEKHVARYKCLLREKCPHEVRIKIEDNLLIKR